MTNIEFFGIIHIVFIKLKVCGDNLKEKEMEYRFFDKTGYVRMDRGDEIISGLLKLCIDEGIGSAIYSGIGGCSEAEIQTFIPETGSFETRRLTGMLELVSLTGNITTDDAGNHHHHTHAVFSYKENGGHCIVGGHLKSVTVLYTAEIELRPVTGGVINRMHDPETGTGFWKFSK